MSFTLPSFGKINLRLRILGKRGDGFHELCTVFQSISLCDHITFGPGDKFSLACNVDSVGTDESNLIDRAAMLLSERYGLAKKAEIFLEKKIPSPGGLGGGSSNAAVALIGLRRLWEIDVSDEELVEVASDIGSDVPYFLTGGTALGAGRGEIVAPIDDVDADNMLIVTPEVSVSTGDAFANVNAKPLTISGDDSSLSVCREEIKSLDLLHAELINDFEPSVFAAHPEIRRVKETLLDLGARHAALSGSGASVFGIFDNSATRQTAIKALDLESTWRKFAVATVSRSEYREALGL